MTRIQRIRRQALERAIELAGGTAAALARELDISRSTVHYWQRAGEIGPLYAPRVAVRLGIPISESRAEE